MSRGILATAGGKGMFVPGEYGFMYKPLRWVPGKPVAIYCCGYGQGAWNLRYWFAWSRLCAEGIPIVATDCGDTPTVIGGSAATAGPGSWANNTAMASLTTLYNWTQTKLGAASKVILMGGSQGGAHATRWAYQNPSKVACVALGIGAVDIEDIRVNNRNGYQASIEAAHGVAAGQPVPNLVTGVSLAPSLTVPVLDYYSDDDGICVAATHHAFAAANPAMIDSRSFGAVAHTLTGYPYNTVVDWCLQHV
jgi:pimeloyl-ACP methyl ester carboxylesterase